jgi:hypothetical protein
VLAALGCGSLTDPAADDELESVSPPLLDAPQAAPPAQRDIDAVVAARAPPLDELDEPSYDTGLRVPAVTNFEFATAPADLLPAGVGAWADVRSRAAPSWSTVDPISGKADLRLDFTFERGPESFDEWVGIGIWRQEVDVRRFSTLVVSLSSDVERRVRILLDSDAYGDELGGISRDFSVDYKVRPEPRAIAIDLREFDYPGWVEDSARGFPVSDAAALELVLQRLTGIVFVPDARIDPEGELVADSETGYLRIDNIHVR